MEFNRNAPHGEHSFHTDLTIRPASTCADQEDLQLSKPLVILVGKFDQSFIDKSTPHYLRAEGFEVEVSDFKGAFERIRWEQPTIVIVDSDNKTDNLVFRLQLDYLTQNIDIIVVVPEYKLCSAPKNSNVFAVSDFRQLSEAIDRARIKNSKSVSNQFHLHKIINDQELRCFVEQTIDSLETLQILMWLSTDPLAVVNVQSFVEMYEVDPFEASQSIRTLARAGYIEPLELETCDPFYGVVAHPEQKEILQKFGKAVAAKEYRIALVTWLLSRTSS